MKQWTLIIALLAFTATAIAQDEEEKPPKVFEENIFTGGSISLSFGNRMFLAGANPMIGYKIAEWVDGGIVINYQYTSFRDYQFVGYKMRQNIYGGGLFTRLYPVSFLFAQAQFEHNFLSAKLIPPDGSTPAKASTSGNSVLIGGGYTNGRVPGVNNTFFYLSILFDVSNNDASPYTDAYGKALPIFRAGINVYPFQPRR